MFAYNNISNTTPWCWDKFNQPMYWLSHIS